MNVITTKDGDVIGFYDDLIKYLKDTGEKAVEIEDFDAVRELLDIVELLEEHKESDELLVIGENNGMGTTVEPYEKGE